MSATVHAESWSVQSSQLQHERDETGSHSHDSIADVEKAIPLNHGDENVIDETAKVTLAGPDPAAFPDGGFDAWMAVAGGFCTVFASFGWINCRQTLDICSIRSSFSLTRHLV